MLRWSRRQFVLASALAIAASGCRELGPPPAPKTAAPPPPPPPPEKSRKVVVIGAGVAGLATAHYLLAAGFDPVVLEASSRAGGRVHTVREPFEDGTWIDLGAKHIVPDPDLIALIQLSGAELTPRTKRPKGLASVSLRGGRRIVSPPEPEPPPLLELTDDEKKLGDEGRRNKYFAPIVGLDPMHPLPDALKKYDDMSAAEYLRSVGASSAAATNYHDAFAPDEPLENLSALSLMREVANFNREIALPPAAGGRVAQGTQRFPIGLADKLGERVTYEAKVVRIEQQVGVVRVTFQRRGETHTIDGARAVCALPSTVLAGIDIAPTFSAEKAKALRELSMVSVTRVFLGARERFWIDEKHVGAVDTDLPMGRLLDETDQRDGRGGVVSVYATGAEARRLAALSEDERSKQALAFAERCHPGFGKRFYASISKCWDDDPFIKGAYAHFRPKELTTLVPALAQAEGSIHFAGDQTSYRPGFMHGAVASAKRVVAEIVG